MTPLEHWQYLNEVWGYGSNDRMRELHDPDFCEKCGEGEEEERALEARR